MKKERDYLGWITLALAILLLLAGGLYVWKTYLTDEKDPIIDDKTEIAVKVVDATVFRFDDLDFQFVIANVEVSSNKSIELGLEMFSSSEGIALNATTFYRDKLTEVGYTLDEYEMIEKFIAGEGSVAGNVFIPILDKNAKTIDVTVNVETPIILKIDLSEADGTKGDVGYVPTDVLTDMVRYEIRLGDLVGINDRTMILTTPSGDSENVDFSDFSNLYALKISIKGLAGAQIAIDQVTFQPDGGVETAHSLGKNYSVEPFTNLIDKKIDTGEDGYIYLQLNTKDDALIRRNGTLKIKLADEETWITVFYIDLEEQ